MRRAHLLYTVARTSGLHGGGRGIQSSGDLGDWIGGASSKKEKAEVCGRVVHVLASDASRWAVALPPWRLAMELEPATGIRPFIGQRVAGGQRVDAEQWPCDAATVTDKHIEIDAAEQSPMRPRWKRALARNY